jgi:hypothetical protein
MKIIADLVKGNLTIEDQAYFSVSNIVRSIKAGTRRGDEVIRSIPGNLPYDPLPFPKGVWKITGIEKQTEKGFDPKVYGPVKIRTDAWQTVKVWKLDEDGDYLSETNEEVKDSGYLLHYSESNTTLGCIRIKSPSDAESLAKIIEKSMINGQAVELIVI